MRSTADVRKPLSGKKPRKVRGAYSLMNRADEIETGTATSTAIRAMTAEPYKADATPNFGCAPVVTNPVVVKNEKPATRNAGSAFKKRKKPIRKRTTKVNPPEDFVTRRNT